MPLATLGNPREGSFFGKISGFTSVSACSVVCEVLAFFAELVIPATSKARRRDSLLRLDEDKNTLKLAQYFDGLQLSMFSRHFPYADDNSISASALPISVSAIGAALSNLSSITHRFGTSGS